MKRVAFITQSALPHASESDALTIPYLKKLDVDVSGAPWDDPSVPWGTFDAIVMRSCWNYHTKHLTFLSFLSHLEAINVPVWNPLSVIRWNSNKHYLFDLEKRHIPIVPTIAIKHQTDMIPQSWTDIIVKPFVGAEAVNVTKINRSQFHFTNPVLVQPYEPAIRQGEYSLIFFDKRYSHSVIKIPKQNDFRSQIRFGGKEEATTASKNMIASAQHILDTIPDKLLYARVDGILINGVFTLMELELSEPYLFLETDEESPKRFAKAIASYIYQ